MESITQKTESEQFKPVSCPKLGPWTICGYQRDRIICGLLAVISGFLLLWSSVQGGIVSFMVVPLSVCFMSVLCCNCFLSLGP